MYHLLGPDETDRLLVNMKLVFISHLHQDHHLGLFTLLRKRREAFDRMGRDFEKCCLLGPGPLFSMHNMWSRLIESVPIATLSYKISTLVDRLVADVSIQKELRMLADWMGGVKEIVVVKVIHPKMAAGLVVTTPDNKRIVYSGDTRPCEELVLAGKGADLLIHEGTFDDSLAYDAESKRHSTTGEAIDIGRQMGAKFTIITHFSSRYHKMPIISEQFDSGVGVAFDNMRVSLTELEALPPMLPVLKELFMTDYRLMETKLENSARKRQLIEEEIQRALQVKGEALIRA